ncbi:hypothetical protein ERJ75_000375600 [Trypanosoma vivax]|nr:hypothetical protein ERJ75_000375600 [Trypanosoma vivax]
MWVVHVKPNDAGRERRLAKDARHGVLWRRSRVSMPTCGCVRHSYFSRPTTKATGQTHRGTRITGTKQRGTPEGQRHLVWGMTEKRDNQQRGVQARLALVRRGWNGAQHQRSGREERGAQQCAGTDAQRQVCSSRVAADSAEGDA